MDRYHKGFIKSSLRSYITKAISQCAWTKSKVVQALTLLQKTKQHTSSFSLFHSSHTEVKNELLVAIATKANIQAKKTPSDIWSLFLEASSNLNLFFKPSV